SPVVGIAGGAVEGRIARVRVLGQLGQVAVADAVRTAVVLVVAHLEHVGRRSVVVRGPLPAGRRVVGADPRADRAAQAVADSPGDRPGRGADPVEPAAVVVAQFGTVVVGGRVGAAEVPGSAERGGGLRVAGTG